MNDLFDSAIQANEKGALTKWMVNYLRNSGRNPVLARGLEKDGAFSTKLIDYPLNRLKILMGPHESFRYYEDPETFHNRVLEMIESLKQGWKPVPLVATDIWNDGLELNDGAHRVEALKRVGIKTYPTVFYFKDQISLDTFLASSEIKYTNLV